MYKDGLEKILTKNNTKPNIFSKNCYKNGNKESYDGNETVYVNQSVLNSESLKESEHNMNKYNSNESNLIKSSNIKTSMVTNDNLSQSKDNNNTNINEQLSLMINSK